MRWLIALGVWLFAAAASADPYPERLVTAADFEAVRAHTAPCRTPENLQPGIRRVGGLVCMRGVIREGAFETLFALSLSADDVLVVSGPGGDGWTAMDIGDYVERVGLTVVVDRSCNSGCSAFVALGAQRTILLSGAYLLFHGRVPRPADVPSRAYFRNEAAWRRAMASAQRFEDTFERRGIDVSITARPPPNMFASDGTSRPSTWTFSPTELRAAGVQRVEFEAETLPGCTPTFCF